MYFHSLIRTQLRFSNLSTDHLLVEAWGLPPLSTAVGGDIKKPVGRNCPLPLVKKMSALLLDSQDSS